MSIIIVTPPHPPGLLRSPGSWMGHEHVRRVEDPAMSTVPGVRNEGHSYICLIGLTLPILPMTPTMSTSSSGCQNEGSGAWATKGMGRVFMWMCDVDGSCTPAERVLGSWLAFLVGPGYSKMEQMPISCSLENSLSLVPP